MRSRRLRLSCAALGLGAGVGLAGADDPLLGFSDEARARQFALEQRFDASLDAANLKNWMEYLTARPHPVGSPYGKTAAHWLAQQFESWGYETRLEVFHVLFPTPRTRVLELIAPTRYVARLVEPPLTQDRTSGQQQEQLPTYNAYSIDGDVTGPLVYVHHGVPEDYDELARRGIDVAGKIVIARYGGSWRGIKPKVAAEHGAIGCLLYSDPRDDGYFQGDAYPEGAFKNENGVQRGSVADMPTYPGDPLTPGVGATKNAVRLDRSEALTLTRIPVLPISYGDARPLLEALAGPLAPASWRGALPITYRLGPGPAEVHLRLEFDWNIVPAYDVIATLRGSDLPDQWIIRGNHHDAWVYGAADPVSGMVATMEEARAIGELARKGWKPRRTVVYAAWDAEEPGLIGSTEWVETHAEALAATAAVYINTDANGRGFLDAGGSHTLERFFNQVSRDVTDPQKGISVRERARALALVRGDTKAREEAAARDDLRLAALGSGSDYTPFLQHLGVASLNVGYGGEDAGGEYHSIYDSFDHYVRFKDPGFAYGLTLARTTGRAVLRLASADLLPFEFRNFSETVTNYAREIRDDADRMRLETERHNGLIDGGRYGAVDDPLETWVVPERLDPVPYLNLAPLENAVVQLNHSAERYELALQLAAPELGSLAPGLRAEVDRLLFTTERALVRGPGLPGRAWFRHHIYAPGFYTGYTVKTLPGVREAVEQRHWEQVDGEVSKVADVLARFAEQVDRAAELLEGAVGDGRP